MIISTRVLLGIAAAVVFVIGLFGLFTNVGGAFGFSCPSIVDSFFSDSGYTGSGFGNPCAKALAARETWAWPLFIVGGGVGVLLRTPRSSVTGTRRFYNGIEVIDVTGGDDSGQPTPGEQATPPPER